MNNTVHTRRAQAPGRKRSPAPPRRAMRRGAAAVFALALMFGCGADRFGSLNPGQQAVFNLGEIAYSVYWDTLDQRGPSDCGAERAAELERWHIKFVDAINATVPTDLTVQFIHNVDSILPLVDDGTIPAMSDDLLGIVKMLRADGATMDALVKLQDAKAVVNSRDTVDFVSRMLGYREFEDILSAVAKLIRENDGVDDAGQPNGEKDLVGSLLSLISDSLKKLDPAVLSGTNDTLHAFIDAILSNATFLTPPNFGAPAWSVRLDTNGNPVVKTDPAGSTLFAPWQDVDADGVADVNSDGDWVNAAGQKITLVPFTDEAPTTFNAQHGTAYQRDTDLRFVTAGGALVFDYYDTKLTALSILVQTLGDLLRADAHGKAVNLLSTIVGPRVTYNAGTATEYQGHDDTNPLIDLAWAQLELAKWSGTPALLDTIADALENNTTLVEDLVVSLSKAIRAAREQYAKSTALSAQVLTDSAAAWTAGALVGRELNPDIKQNQSFTITANDATTITVDPTDGDMTTVAVIGDRYRLDLAPRLPLDSWQLAEDWLPVIDRLFDTQVTQGGTQPPSVARAILSKLAQIPTQDLQNLPQQLAVMSRYSTAVAENPVTAADPDDIDQALSTPVDFSLPVQRGANGQLTYPGHNASIMQQLMEVTYLADQCGSVKYFFGGAPYPNPTLATDVLETMATSTPQTVKTLVSILLWFQGVAGIVCTPMGQNMTALDGLCKSGALNAILPIAAVFHQSNDIRLLADLFITMHKNYDPSINSDALRQGEPGLADFFESGALEHIFEALVKMNTINVPGSTTGEVMNDLLADSLANLVDDDDPTLVDRKGAPVQYTKGGTGSKALLVVWALKELDTRVKNANQDTLQEALTDTLFDQFLKLDDNGTPADTSDDTRLANQSLIPLLAKLLRFMADQTPRDPVQRGADLSKYQTDTADWLKGAVFADLVEIMLIMDRAPSKKLFDDGIINLLTPNPNQNEDLFGNVLKTLASVLKAKADEASVKQVGRFLGNVLDPKNRYVTGLIDGLVKILDRDAGRTLLTMARNAVNRRIFDDVFFEDSPLYRSAKAPVEVLLDLFKALRETGCTAKPGGAGKLTRAQLEETLDRTISFMEDTDRGLPFFYDVIRARTKP